MMNIRRISISIPENLAEALDRMVVERGFLTRSQAVAEMVQSQLVRHLERYDEQLMAGTISLTYDRTLADCGASIAHLQHQFLRECIASLHVQLEQGMTLEVILVQGQAQTLRNIANQMIAIRGVAHGELNMSTQLLPPIEAAS